MNRGTEDSQTIQENIDQISRRKRQIWIIVVVMMVSFCVGTAGLLALLWFVIKVVIPQLNF